jgi:uncharacterized protein (TIGR03067 family)
MSYRMLSVLIFIFVSALVSVAAPPQAGATKADLEKLQGDWAEVSVCVDGVKASDDEAQSIFQTIKGDRYTLSLFNKSLVKGTLKIDATKKPKTIDMTTTDGPGKDTTTLGVYEIDGDTLKICSAQPGKDRPQDLTSKKGSGHVLSVWEREKK